MSGHWRLLIVLLLLLGLVPVAGAIAVGEPLEFDDTLQSERYHRLLTQLRCTVCQNQSLDESNAGLARDLRRQLYGMVREGRGEDEIRDYLVTRYGDFVLYRPPLRPNTYLLWFGPLLLLLGGTAVAWSVLKSQRGAARPALAPQEKARLEALLRQHPGDTR